MGQWVPIVDNAVGGVADQFTGAGNYVLGGLGDLATGATTTTGQALGGGIGSFFGGLFGGAGRFLLMALGIGVAGLIALQVV